LPAELPRPSCWQPSLKPSPSDLRNVRPRGGGCAPSSHWVRLSEEANTGAPSEGWHFRALPGSRLSFGIPPKDRAGQQQLAGALAQDDGNHGPDRGEKEPGQDASQTEAASLVGEGTGRRGQPGPVPLPPG